MRAVRTVAGLLAGLILVAALAAWLVPPLLDWGRYRSTIASIAAARLGRPVAIGGAVTLRLLPHAVLTATDVTLPDQGDGLSARLATMRLQVALGALLGGRLAATDLVLGAPVLRLPWTLPAAVTGPLRPPVPRGFGARIEGGSLQIGRLALTGINATLVGDAGTGSLRASGEATSGALPWRFRAVLGAPGKSGASRVEIAVAGQDRLRDTGGTLKGMLSGTELAGEIDLGGGDLSRLLAGPGLPWRVRGAISATGERIEAPALALQAGGGAAQGRAAISLAPARLDLAIATASFVPALWMPLLGRAPALGVPLTLDLSAERAGLLGDRITGLDLHLAGDGAALRVDRARAVLPGGATATLSGTIGRDASGAPDFAGPGTLDMPDPRATLHWLRVLAPAVVDAVPASAMAHGALAGNWRLAQGALAIDSLGATFGDDRAQGSLAVRLAARPEITADLQFDRLMLDVYLPPAPDLPSRLTDPGFDATMHLHAASSGLWGQSLADVSIDASTGLDGVRLRQASATLGGARVNISGRLDPDGAIADGRLTADIPDMARLVAEVPQGWASKAPLWRGAASMELSVAGPRDALALQLRAGLGDLRVEAESLLDARLGSASATVTLRHPGAPRLLADLGLNGTQAWLDTGSAALLCHLRLTPGRVVAQDFELNAAAFRASGNADIDLSGAAPRVTARLNADTLPLPDWTIWRVPSLPAWAAAAALRLHVEAGEILSGLRPVAHQAVADIAAEQGIVLAQPVGATVAGGKLSASFAADLARAPPLLEARAELAGATVAGPLTGLPVDPVDASFDLSVSLEGTGAGAEPMTGEVRSLVRAASVAGIDLPRVAASLALPQREREQALRASLGSGTSTGFEGVVEAAISGSRLTLQRGLLTAPSGTLDAAGGIDLAAGTAHLHLVGKPAVASPPAIGIDLAGDWSSARRSDRLDEAMRWGEPASAAQQPQMRPRPPAKPKRKRPRP